MKQLSIALLITLTSFAKTYAQNRAGLPNTDILPSILLNVTCNKTTNLIFPFQIKSVDRGSKDLLVQKANGVENVLQVKAAKEDFIQTNLSVITNDGKLYSFIVNYAIQPLELNIRLLKDSSDKVGATPNTPPINNEALMDADAHYIAQQPKNVSGIKDKKYGILIRVVGLYIRENVLYFQIQLRNKTPISYDIDILNLMIKDKKEIKRTAFQQIPVDVLYTVGNKDRINSDTNQTVVVAVSKFTIPDKKWLYIQMRERHGGRHLEMKVSNRKIIHSIPLPDH